MGLKGQRDLRPYPPKSHFQSHSPKGCRARLSRALSSVFRTLRRPCKNRVDYSVCQASRKFRRFAGLARSLARELLAICIHEPRLLFPSARNVWINPGQEYSWVVEKVWLQGSKVRQGVCLELFGCARPWLLQTTPFRELRFGPGLTRLDSLRRARTNNCRSSWERAGPLS